MTDVWLVRDPDRGNERECASKSEAENAASELKSLGIDAEIVSPAERTNGQNPVEVESEPVENLPEKNIDEDPIDWMPSHFVDEIQGVPAINRKGYAVLAEHCGVSVTAEPVTRPAETDFEYAEFQAIATTPDGAEYSGYGSAHVDRDDDPTLLAELAETRAMKRATAWATGVGMTAIEEMQGER